MTRLRPLRVMIWGKTYPELSTHHHETVCTAGVTEDGDPIRLYPVRLRYLQGDKQYSLYDVIEVTASRNAKDPRPESFKVRDETINILDRIPTDSDEWAARHDWIWRRADKWHFRSMDQLLAAQSDTGQSIGMLEVGAISGVYLREKSAREAEAHRQKFESISSQFDAFLPEYKQLDFISTEVRLKWSCAVRCATCRQKPHDMQVLDWGLMQLGRKAGWLAAKAKMEAIADLEQKDFRLFLGNFFLHQQTFGIIGLWYPQRSEQQLLF